MKISYKNLIINFLAFLLLFPPAKKNNIAFAQAAQDDGWKNFMGYPGAQGISGANDAARYAKQTGYDYIIVKDVSDAQDSFITNYKDKSVSGGLYNGLKYFVDNPYFSRSVYQDISRWYPRDPKNRPTYIDGPFNPRIFLRTEAANIPQSNKDFYEGFMVWKNNNPFPDNIDTGFRPDGDSVSVMWDFQQQRVIDYVISGIMELFALYETPNFQFAGYMEDASSLYGDFTYWDPLINNGNGREIYTSLYHLINGVDVNPTETQQRNASSVWHPGITHEYSSNFEGHAAFIKALGKAMKARWPNSKRIGNPWNLYKQLPLFNPDETLYQIKDRADRVELMPDLLLQESASAEFADEAASFAIPGFNKNMAGISQNREVREDLNRLYAAKAGINGMWFNWFQQIGGQGNAPAFSALVDVYPRLKLIRVIPNWDNLSKVPLSVRSWNNNITNPIYDSYDANGYQQSHIDANLMYSRHWKTGKLFAVFNTGNGVIKLKPGESVASVSRATGYLEEEFNDTDHDGIRDAGENVIDASGDLTINDGVNGKEIRLNSSVIIPVDDRGTTVTTDDQAKGAGYIFTLTSAPILMPPTVTTTEASNVNVSSATLNGTVNPKGDRATAVYFQYGTVAGSYNGMSSSQAVSGASNINMAIPISGLASANIYYYRIVAENSAQVKVNGSEMSFITSNPKDAQAPALPSISINNGAASTSLLNVTLNLSASDNIGVTGYYVSESPAAPNSQTVWVEITSAVNYSNPNISFTLSSVNGAKTVYVWYKDAAGNISAMANDGITLATTRTAQDDSWKNFFGVYGARGIDGAKEAAIYAKQMGYDYIVAKGYNPYLADSYKDKNNSMFSGLKYYVLDCYNDNYSFQGVSTWQSGSSRRFLKPEFSPTVMSPEDQAFYEGYMVWKSTTQTFPENINTGYRLSNNEVGTNWDLQQQRVIDYLVDRAMELFALYESDVNNFHFAGVLFDNTTLSGGEFDVWNTETNPPTGRLEIRHLQYLINGGNWNVNASSLWHPGITHEYPSYTEGNAAFQKKLISRMRGVYPDAKWGSEPYYIYRANAAADVLFQIKDRADRAELLPDLLLQESSTTEFADMPEVYNFPGITRDMLGITQPNQVGEALNRLYAAKAGINGSWYNWFLRFGGTGTMPAWYSPTEVYPRLKLIRAIPGWDNLNNIPLVNRSWNNSATNPIYQSPNSYISVNVMYSRHWKTGKLFAVFNTNLEPIKVRPNETITSIQRTDGLFIESGDGSADVDIIDGANGKEIRLNSSVIIPTDSTNNQIKGVGYILTIAANTQDIQKPTVTIISPTAASTYTATFATIGLSGTALDNVGVASVTWSNSATGATGAATGTTSWSMTGVSVVPGNNIITVTATDRAGNTASDTITIAYAVPDVGFNCTQVIGFSQAIGWFQAGFEQAPGIDNSQWQYLGHPGASIEMWTNPNYDGWLNTGDRLNYVDSPNTDNDHIYSNCATNAINPDRVIVSITSTPNPLNAPSTSITYQNKNEKISADDLNDWIIDIKTVISVIKSKYSNARQIVLQPVIGGPNHSLCPSPASTPADLLARYPNVRASVNHPIVDQAIDSIVAELGAQSVAKGFSPLVRGCSDYADYMGHLTNPGYTAAAATIGNYYGSLSLDPTPPSISILAPGNAGKVSGTTAITGAASDNVAVSSVAVSIDGAAYRLATGTASWTFNLNTAALTNSSHTIIARAVDASGNAASAAITVVVNNPVTLPVITSASSAAGTVGTAFSYQITAANSPTSFNAAGLPASLSASTGGLISGTPATIGTSSVTINAANASGTGAATLALSVYSACDVNRDWSTNVTDVQLQVNQAMGAAACTSDLNRDGSCSVIDVQRGVNAGLGGQCVLGP